MRQNNSEKNTQKRTEKKAKEEQNKTIFPFTFFFLRALNVFSFSELAFAW